MARISRRQFVQRSTGTAALGLSVAGLAQASQPVASPDTTESTVRLTGDGLDLDPAAYARLLARLCDQRGVAPDSYCLGGEIERFEQKWAELLGKETAVFMPSGTLANQLALRALAGTRRRVIVPETSHIYNDTGDACQTLSGLTLMPLAPGRATFTTTDLEQVHQRTASGRVATGIGAIVIESPVRRLAGEMFDWGEMQKVSRWAREHEIGLHLDGARLFIASAYSDITPAAYAGLFDTVYVSLWKYFNSGVGAILAGPRRVLDGMFHVRRMFGGNLAVGWPAALVAQHFMDGFVDRLRSAVRVSEQFYTALGAHPSFAIERIANGTNLVRVTIRHADPQAFRRRLREERIMLGEPDARGMVTIAVNETWNRTTAPRLMEAFNRALG